MIDYDDNNTAEMNEVLNLREIAGACRMVADGLKKGTDTTDDAVLFLTNTEEELEGIASTFETSIEASTKKAGGK